MFLKKVYYEKNYYIYPITCDGRTIFRKRENHHHLA